MENNKCTPTTYMYLLLAECEVGTESYGPSFFPSFHENKEGKNRGSITCRADRANEATKMFIICMALFTILESSDLSAGDQELEVRKATYGPEIDQSQHAKSVSHIIITFEVEVFKSLRTFSR